MAMSILIKISLNMSTKLNHIIINEYINQIDYVLVFKNRRNYFYEYA